MAPTRLSAIRSLPIRIVIHGLQGPLEVGGQKFNNVMAPLGELKRPTEIADVLTYVRQSWSNDAPPVPEDTVKQVRAKYADRENAVDRRRTEVSTPTKCRRSGAYVAAFSRFTPRHHDRENPVSISSCSLRPPGRRARCHRSIRPPTRPRCGSPASVTASPRAPVRRRENPIPPSSRNC